MAKLKPLVGLCAFLVAPLAEAQVNPEFANINDAIEMIRDMVQLERKDIVAEELALTGEESTNFWPVYDAYVAERAVVNDRLVKLITDYAANYLTMSDEMATTLVDDYFDVEADRLKVRRKYVRELGDVLPPKKLARFVQIENKLDTIVQVDIASEIPLLR
jgi:hypothetical protein